MIPKIIHYCWFGGKKMPRYLKKYLKTWTKFCPDYQIICWNEKKYDVNKSAFVKKAYSDKKWAFVTDYVRLDVVNTYGGIYLDTDVELLKNLDSLLKNKCFFAIQQDGLFINTGLAFGSEKNNPLLLDMMKEYDLVKLNSIDYIKIACPYLNTLVLEKFGYKKNGKNQKIDKLDCMIYEPLYFDPLNIKLENLLCDKTYSVHHYSATWLSKKTLLKKKIIRIFGEKNIIRIKNKHAKN